MRPNYRLKSEVSIMLCCQLCSNGYTAFQNQGLFEKHLYNPRMPNERNGAMCPSYINYRLKSEVSIMLLCRLCPIRYTAVQMKNCLKSTSAIKIVTMKNTDFSLQREAITCYHLIDTFRCQQR